MQNIDWNVIGRYVPEVILVVIFMGYTYIRDAAGTIERVERTRLNAIERQERDLSWREFLKDERDARTAWAAQAAAQIAQLALLIAATNGLLVQHDTWERASADRNLQRTS